MMGCEQIRLRVYLVLIVRWRGQGYHPTNHLGALPTSRDKISGRKGSVLLSRGLLH